MEGDFPRGGRKPRSTGFQFLGNSDKIGKKRRYRPKVAKIDTDEGDDRFEESLSDSEDGIKPSTTDRLCNETIQEGMIILGRIMEIFDTKLSVSLPGGLRGFVMASHVSTPYMKLLQSYVNDEIEEVKKLETMFSLGEYVSVKVLSITRKPYGKICLMLSIMPQDINGEILFSNIHEGIVLRGAIESIEDHGYIVDLGISNCRAFLPENLKDDTLELDIGKVIWCVVKKYQKSTSNTIITVSNKLKKLKVAKINKVEHFTPSDLRPGMSLDFFVNKPLKDGAEGIILCNSMGYIHTSQIANKLHVGNTEKAYLLYIMPVSKLLFFTTRDIFNSFKPDLDKEATLKIGEIIHHAKVIKVSNNNVILKIEENVAIMSKKLSQNGISSESYFKSYYVGSEHSIRIINYHPSDYAYICTDKQHILEKKYFSLQDLQVGELVNPTVVKILDRGIRVKIDKINGWIPDFHASDVGIYETTKTNTQHSDIINKKFKIDQEISARVLKVYVSKNILHLTAKPSLLSKDLIPLSCYEEAKIGCQYKGVITAFLDFGVIVTFFNDVKTCVNVRNMSSEKITDIKKYFNIGQVVNCTVLHVDVEKKKMQCSFIHRETVNNEDIKENLHKKSKQSKKCMKNDNNVENKYEDPSSDSEKKSDKNDCVTDTKETKKKNRRKRKRDEEIISSQQDSCISDVVESTQKKDNNNQIKEIVFDAKKKTKNKLQEKKIPAISCIEGDVNRETESINEVQKSRETRNITFDETVNKKKKINESTNNQVFSDIRNFWNLDATIFKNTTGESNEIISDSENERVEKKKKKRLTTAEKVEKIREEEEKLRNIEQKLIALDSQPQSSDQFDRLLLANPNNSELWIAYMAFHLQATEIDRARAIARKALSIISFREEDEKLNVWLALLNLENRFGTKESLNITLQEALQVNDRFQIHSKMLDIYADTGKITELSSLVDTMITKYKTDPGSYVASGQACYKLNMVEKARAVMQKAVNRLENKHHVPLLIKFAHMEYNNGDVERAETIFEQIVGCLPQRTDVWCVYIDMLMKSGRLENTRLLFERALSQTMPTKKMKALYKKWIQIEQQFGDSGSVERVRQAAVDYIENLIL